VYYAFLAATMKGGETKGDKWVKTSGGIRAIT
jgi:hypothetical protein